MGSTSAAYDLHHYLREARSGLLRSLDGLGEYDIRRPMTPSGTNLLGLVKHLTDIEASYLGSCVERPAPITLPWVDDGSIWDGSDMWATADESRDYILGLYAAATEHADTVIEELPLDAPAYVEWWAEGRRHSTFGHLLTRVVAETAQHAGHADIIRESIDGRGGRDHDDVGGEAWWSAYVASIQAAADTFR
ncbi:DinB family protein [Nocardioidaceae bacterium SCSIO 66511]|nr:DinB family protein [Nocardioidaceae bacterium SCSIO 66511]